MGQNLFRKQELSQQTFNYQLMHLWKRCAKDSIGQFLHTPDSAQYIYKSKKQPYNTVLEYHCILIHMAG